MFKRTNKTCKEKRFLTSTIQIRVKKTRLVRKNAAVWQASTCRIQAKRKKKKITRAARKKRFWTANFDNRSIKIKIKKEKEKQGL